MQQHKAESTEVKNGGGLSRSSVDNHGNMEGAKGLGHFSKQVLTIPKGKD